MTHIGYYVTAIEGKRVAWLCGPFSVHAIALAMVPMIKAAALDSGDPHAAFAAYGTTKLEAMILPIGKLNHIIA